MDFRKAFAGTALLLSLSAAPAFAQHFDGPYAGVQASWRGGRGPQCLDRSGDSGTDGDNGLTRGMFVGYNRQVAPRIVVGVEAGMDFSSDGWTVGAGIARQLLQSISGRLETAIRT